MPRYVPATYPPLPRPQDVVVGGLIGGACALLMYRLRHPPLAETDAPHALCTRSRADSCKASDDSTAPYSPSPVLREAYSPVV